MFGFGRRKQQPLAVKGLPIADIQRALDNALWAVAAELSAYGIDCKGWTGVEVDIATISDEIASSLISQGEQGPEFMTLARSKDMQSFDFNPHLQLFHIQATLNTYCELRRAGTPRNHLCAFLLGQCLSAIITARLLRHWLQFAGPTGQALASGSVDALRHVAKQSEQTLLAVLGDIPPALSEHVELQSHFDSWQYFPVILTETFDESKRGPNNLPMNQSARESVTVYMAQVTLAGVTERNAA